MAKRYTLPYYAPPELLPAPLPTAAEMLAVDLKGPNRVSCDWESPVIRMGDHFAVKYGGKYMLQEGENMLFVQDSTNIPIPKVYAIFTDTDTSKSFIVMEYIPGTNLEVAWPGLGTTQKRAIFSQLRRHMNELRSIPSPGYYGGLWKEPIQTYYFSEIAIATNRFECPEPEIVGPKETEAQWVDSMLLCIQRMPSLGKLRQSQHEYLRQTYHAILKGHAPVFTHATLLRRNIMLREDGTVVIIDWKNAGWYPSFWEYCTSMIINGRSEKLLLNDFYKYIPEMLDEYVAELDVMDAHDSFIRHRCPPEYIMDK